MGNTPTTATKAAANFGIKGMSQPLWFELLFGFAEEPSSIRSSFTVTGSVVEANGRIFNTGAFSTPKLSYLRTAIVDISNESLNGLCEIST